MLVAAVAKKLFSRPFEWMEEMFSEIEKAQKSILIEMYKVGNDEKGKKLVSLLCKKASEGVKVKLLADAYGSNQSGKLFEELRHCGGQVRVFQVMRLTPAFLTQAHKRDHRKIVIIDGLISYIGSANVTAYCEKWRECIVKFENTAFAETLKYIFSLNFNNYNKYNFRQKKHWRIFHSSGLEVIRDLPSIFKQKVKRKYEYMISRANESVYIETPYFLPGFGLRKAMADAIGRGVKVTVCMPFHSDVRAVDLLRNRYLGILYKKGVDIRYFLPGNLHSKLMIVDQNHFIFGSSNFDYRSFRYMYEIMLAGSEKITLELFKQHATQTLAETEAFDFRTWERRSWVDRLFERILIPFRHLF